MSEIALQEQSAEVASLLSKLIRRLFSLYSDDPAMDLPVAQMRVCGILRDGPRAMSVISRELGVTQSAMTQIADRLERAGMVERVSEPEDRRVKSLQLTSRGVEIMRSRSDRRISRVVKAMQQLSPDERNTAVFALNKLLQASIATAPEVSEDTPISELLS